MIRRIISKNRRKNGSRLTSVFHFFPGAQGACPSVLRDYLDAMIESEMNSNKIRELLRKALTDKIDDRETFMKGIDYSYYYEQED